MPFLNFLLNTIRPRLNDEHNKHFWLPAILKGIDGPEAGTKLLPLKIDKCNIGALKGDARKTVIDGFLIGMRALHTTRDSVPKLNLKVEDIIPDPDSPDPLLSFSNLVLNGLENQWVLDNLVVNEVENGCEITITLQPDHYDESTGLAKLGIKSDYLLSIKGCSADRPDLKYCNGKIKQQVDGVGKVTLSIVNVLIKATVLITTTGEGADRQINAQFKGIVVTDLSKDEPMGIDVDDLSVESSLNKHFVGEWRNMAVRAITSEEGTQGIFLQINGALGDAGNLKSLSAEISPRLKDVLDSIFGAVVPHELPVGGQPVLNRVDGYLFDRIRYTFNNIDNDWYLPKAVCSLTSPVVEPLQVERIDLPDQVISGLKFVNLRITDLNIVGFSNILAPAAQLLFDEKGNLNATVKICELNPPPSKQFSGKNIPAPPLKATAKITLEFGSTSITIDLGITVQSAEVNFLNEFSGGNVEGLRLDLKYLRLTVNPDVFKIELAPTSPFSGKISATLNTPEIKKEIIDKLNDYAAANLKSISEQVTNAMRAGIISRLDT